MKIHETVAPITTEYRKLAYGDIIKDSGHIYMKTKEGQSKGCATDIFFTHNAICLDDGSFAYFAPDYNVLPVTNYSFEYSI